MVYKPTSLYIDPTKRTQEMEDFGIRSLPEFKGSAYNLGAVEGFPDVRYATTDYGKYSDLYRLYSGMPGGFGTTPETTPPASGGGGTGGGGGDGGAGTGGTGGVNTPFEQNLIDQGVGVQIAPGQPVVAPGEMPVTQEEMDAFNQIPVTPVGGQPIDPLGMLPQISTQPDLGEITADDYGTPTYAAGTAPLEDAGAGIDDMYGTDYQGEQPQDTSIIMQNIGEGITEDDIESIPITINAAPNIMNTPGVTTDEGALIPGDISVMEGLEGSADYFPELGSETYKATDTAESIGKKLGKIPGALYDAANKTISIGGKSINLLEAGAKALINKLAGGPVTLLLDALKGMDLPGGPSDLRKGIEGAGYTDPITGNRVEIKTDDIGRMTTGPMAGYNIDSQFGDPEKAAEKRVDNISQTLSEKYNFSPSEIEQIKAGNITSAIKTKGMMKDGSGKTTNLINDLAQINAYKDQVGGLKDIQQFEYTDSILEDTTADWQGVPEPEVTVETVPDIGPITEDDDDFVIGDETPVDTLAEQRAKEQADAQRAMQEQIAIAERQEAERVAAAEAAAIEQARAQREMQERIAAAEREEAARRDRENRQREQEQQAAAQRAAEARAARERARRASEEAAARARDRHGGNGGNQGTGAGAGGGSQQATSGGGFSSGWGGGWGWSKGGIVSLKNAKR